MSLDPRHPDEPALHHELRDELNEHLTNPNFFVWIEVKPTGHQTELGEVAQIVNDTERWLGSLDPDDVRPDDLPEQVWSDPAAEVHITAIPKSPQSRGRRADQIVGNPEPILVGYVE
jgi:hypothetical protein